MRSTIPDDGVPIAQPTGNGTERQEASLHDEILLRLRDYVVEGNIPDGARVPERKLCEMLGISRTPLRETLKTAYANFAGRIRRVRYSANFARKRQRWAEAMREHEAILDALRRRAGSELSDILFQHLRNKRMAAIEHLTEAHEDAPATP